MLRTHRKVYMYNYIYCGNVCFRLVTFQTFYSSTQTEKEIQTALRKCRQKCKPFFCKNCFTNKIYEKNSI